MPKTISLRYVVVIVLGLGSIPGIFFGARFGFVFGAATWFATTGLAFSLIMALDKLEKSGQQPESV